MPNQVTDWNKCDQRLIESFTGHSTRLFRTPYIGDAEPRRDDFFPTVEAQNMGYISIGLHIDPDDWKTVKNDGTRHTADEIVADVLRQAAITTPEERGNIVLLHDSGGDRSETIKALPMLIDDLRAKGYEFTTLSDLAGITRDQAMPAVSRTSTVLSRSDAYVFYAISLGGWLIRWLFLLGILLGIGQMVLHPVLPLCPIHPVATARDITLRRKLSSRSLPLSCPLTTRKR